MSEWISVKKSLPPFGIFVEVVYGPKSRMNDLYRGFCCLWQGDEKDGVFWSQDSSDERDTGKYEITHWRTMHSDPRGKIPVLYITKRNDFKVKMKKVTTTVPT